MSAGAAFHCRVGAQHPDALTVQEGLVTAELLNLGKRALQLHAGVTSVKSAPSTFASSKLDLPKTADLELSLVGDG